MMSVNSAIGKRVLDYLLAHKEIYEIIYLTLLIVLGAMCIYSEALKARMS